MQVKLDKSGRVSLPKRFRDAFGLKPGSIIDIEKSHHKLVLGLQDKEMWFEDDEGLLIFTAEAIGDLKSAPKSSAQIIK